MTQLTYDRLIKLDKEYLVDFIKEVEQMPHVGYIGGDDLSTEEIMVWDDFYKKWYNN